MNQLTYTRVGEYLLPDLVLSEPENNGAPSGLYAHMRRAYLREHCPILYTALLLSEKLYPHLREIDEAAARRLALAGNEQRHQAGESILRELVYGE